MPSAARALLGFAVSLAVLVQPAGAAPGDLDTSFAGKGFRVGNAIPEGFTPGGGTGGALDSNGRLVASVSLYPSGGSGAQSGLVRLLPDGTMDPGLGNEGFLVLPPGRGAVALDAADRPLVATGLGATRAVARLAGGAGKRKPRSDLESWLPRFG